MIVAQREDAACRRVTSSNLNRETRVKRSLRFRRPLMTMLAFSMVVAACASNDDIDADTDADTDVDTDIDTDTDDGDDRDDGDDGDTAADGERHHLRVGGVAADMGQSDPQFASTGMDRQILLMKFEGLVRFVPNDMLAGFEPAIATEVPEEAPEPNDDGTQTWEFEIREGVMCHGGPDWDPYELTPEMVVSSYEKSMDGDRAAFAGDYAVVDSIELTGDRTVAFNLSAPRSAALFLPLVADFAGGYVVCMDHLEEGYQDLEGFAEHPVGTGPFQWMEYSPGDQIELASNDDYWRGQPNLSGVTVRFMPDDSSRTLALQSGEIDFMYGVLEQEWLDRVNGEEGLTAIAIPLGGLQTISFNTLVEPFDDIDVRKALAYAHNREEHIALGGPDIRVAACSIEPLPGHPGGISCEEAAEDYPWITEHDPELARELLADAGYPDGFSFEVATSEWDLYRDNYAVFQSALAEIGVDMQLDVVDHPTMHSVIRENANEVVVYSAPRPTIEQHMMQFVHSSASVAEGESPVTNFSHFSGADDVIEAAQVETDLDTQNELWREANRLILEAAVIMPNALDNNTFGWREGFDPGTATNASLETSMQINEMTDFNPS